MNYGSKIWIFPDAECPPEGVNSIPGHESIIITNTCDHNAHIKFTLFFTDKDPVQLPEITVNAKRVRCLRTNNKNDFGQYTIPINEQYAIMLESDWPVIAQYGRADPRTIAFYTTPGYNTN